MHPNNEVSKNASKFYARNSAGKYQMDVGELRTAFTLSQNTIERIRNGIIEAVDLYLLGSLDTNISPTISSIKNSSPIIPSIKYEKRVIERLLEYVSLQKKLAVEPPLFIMLSLLNVKGYQMKLSQLSMTFPGYDHPIDRENLVMSEVMVENFNFEPSKVLKPIFDDVWNACGYPGSLNYDDSGNWFRSLNN